MTIPISIVVIFYNQNDLVCRALESVVGQTYRQLDIIVVDDGSDEPIESLLDGFEDDRIHFFRKENGGAASARNLGIREAKGDYIAFLDGDDLFLPNRIERLVSFLSEREWPVCMVTSGHYVVTKSGWVVDRRMPSMDENGEAAPFSEMYTSCSIYHRKTIDRFGGFPENLRINEDGALNAQISQQYPIYGLAEALTLYLVDNAGKARRSLSDYDWAVQVMEDRLRIADQTCGSQVMDQYRDRSEINLFYGFLSCGNMSAAKRWYPQVRGRVLGSSLAGRLAVFSVRSGINLYAGVRRTAQMIRGIRFIPQTMWFRRMFF